MILMKCNGFIIKLCWSRQDKKMSAIITGWFWCVPSVSQRLSSRCTGGHCKDSSHELVTNWLQPLPHSETLGKMFWRSEDYTITFVTLSVSFPLVIENILKIVRIVLHHWSCLICQWMKLSVHDRISVFLITMSRNKVVVQRFAQVLLHLSSDGTLFVVII